MPIGSLVVVRPTMDLSVDSRTLSPEQIDKVNKVETIDVGDVIVYAPRRASGVMVIHRVLSVSQDSRGQREFITKGDANPAQDQPVAGYQVRAVSWYHVPVLGYVNTWIGSGNRKLVAISFAVVGYAWSVVLVTRSLRRGADLNPAGRQRGPTHADPRV